MKNNRRIIMPVKNNNGCTLHDCFSFKDKLLMRTGWYGFTIVGIYGIYKQTPLWALAYILYVIIGYSTVVIPWLCAHCPYPYKMSACLFMPAGFLRKFYAYRGPEPVKARKIAANIIMAGTVIIPNFWLVNNVPLLIIFWLFGLPTLIAFPFHYCKHCRHFGCSLNRAQQ